MLEAMEFRAWSIRGTRLAPLAREGYCALLAFGYHSKNSNPPSRLVLSRHGGTNDKPYADAMHA
jgi:hypothetical protein